MNIKNFACKTAIAGLATLRVVIQIQQVGVNLAIAAIDTAIDKLESQINENPRSYIVVDHPNSGSSDICS